ncbi:aminotransferase family protein [Paenibacillus sp. SYP-B4298]|uniref:aminotransferase family protein n=1 Tax=Paenibacillus sp. SYP-B4298 TaxID=2996034 RepID=UPI0022DE3C88|nr:aminotransferase class III-fold pyridoxal phosphate-dependent enzyme [Paenibacillus sp. SYP-B4298]
MEQKVEVTHEQRYPVLHPFTFMPGYEGEAGDLFHQHNIMLHRGSGSWVYDTDERPYLYTTTAVPSVGLGNEQVMNRIRHQYETLSFGSTCGQTHPLIQQLSERLLHIVGDPFGMVFYGTDGSGAVETAMRLARQYFIAQNKPKRTAFISLEGNYHGTTYGTGAVTHLGIQESFGPGMSHCYAAPFPFGFRPPIEGTPDGVVKYCLDMLEEIIFDIGPYAVAAVLLEPVQGVNGIHPLPVEYVQAVRKITEKYGILLIMDEVTTGIGRTGSWIASHHYGVQADMLTLSKGLTGGYFPMGATLISTSIARQLFGDGGIFLHGSTQSGHPVGCAAALAVLDLIEEGELLNKTREHGELILQSLRSNLQLHPHVGDIRGMGLMLAIEFVQEKQSKTPVDYAFGQQLSKALHSEGILGNYFNNTLLMYPPLTITREESQQLIDGVTRAVLQVSNDQRSREE